MAAFIMMNQGYHVYGADALHDQIIITSKGQVRRSMRWVSSYIPGIY